MSDKLQDEILEELVARAEADETGKIMYMIQELIAVSSEAANLGFELQELAAVCTTGHFLGTNPEYLQAMEYLMKRGGEPETEH
jgi:hypothetical protein